MAYNPNLYNPYGTQQYQPTLSYQQQYQPTMQPQQPVNGLVQIDGIEGANMYPLPPNSTSPALFFKNEAKFAVKSTDGGGAVTVRVFNFEEETLQTSNPNDIITRQDLEDFKKQVMEAINGKPAVSEPAAE